MIRPEEPKAVMTAILIAIASLGCLVFVAFTRIAAVQSELAASVTAPVDVSDWNTYHNDTYGFSVEYPPEWTVNTNGLAAATPFLTLGNPLSGIKTYALQIFIENNADSLSSGEYVHALLAADRAADAASGADNGLAPRETPQFTKAYVLTADGYSAYELYDVFEFDRNAERVYVAHGNETLRFDFPVAEENPNLSLPVANNGTAHEIMDTLIFTQ